MKLTRINMLDRVGRMKSSAPNANPVFCNKCKHYIPSDMGDSEACDYPDNIKYIDTHTNRIKSHHADPCNLNSYNDCDWYEPSFFTILKGRLVLIKETIRAIFAKKEKNKNGIQTKIS